MLELEPRTPYWVSTLPEIYSLNLSLLNSFLSGSIVQKVSQARERLCSVAIESSIMLISVKSTHL